MSRDVHVESIGDAPLPVAVDDAAEAQPEARPGALTGTGAVVSVNTNGAAGPESTAQAVAQPVAPVRKRQLAAELLGRRREREALSLASASSSVAATSASSVASSTASTAASTATPLQAQPPGQAATQSDYDPLRLYRQQYEHYVKTYGQGGGMQGGAASALVPTAGSTSLTTTAGSAMPNVESAAATVVPSSGQTDVPPSPMPSSSSTSTATTTLSPTTATTPTTAVTTTASRVIYMGNLPSDATLSHVLGVVRGGMVESARLVKEKHCAFVAFLDATAAQSFHHEATAGTPGGLTLHQRPLKIGWAKDDQPVAAHVLQAVRGQSASRNVFIGNVDAELTVERLTADLSVHGPIDTVDLLSDKRIAFVHFTSIAHALEAVEAAKRHDFYRRYRWGFGKDRCDRNGAMPSQAVTPVSAGGDASQQPQQQQQGYATLQQQQQQAYPPTQLLVGGATQPQQQHHAIPPVQPYAPLSAYPPTGDPYMQQQMPPPGYAHVAPPYGVMPMSYGYPHAPPYGHPQQQPYYGGYAPPYQAYAPVPPKPDQQQQQPGQQPLPSAGYPPPFGSVPQLPGAPMPYPPTPYGQPMMALPIPQQQQQQQQSPVQQPPNPTEQRRNSDGTVAVPSGPDARVVWVGGLTDDTTIEDLCNAIRVGGPLFTVNLIRDKNDKNCAFLTFVDTSSADTLIRHGTTPGISVKGKKLRVGPGKPFALPADSVRVLASGATRNLYFGGVDPAVHTVQRFREDFQQFGAIEQIHILPDKNTVMDAARALAAVQRNENNVREHYEGIRVMYGKDRVAGIYKEKPGAGQQGGQSRQQQQSGGATRSRDGPHQRQQPYPRSRPNAPSAGAASAPRNGQSTGVAAPQSSAGETPVVGIL